MPRLIRPARSHDRLDDWTHLNGVAGDDDDELVARKEQIAVTMNLSSSTQCDGFARDHGRMRQRDPAK
jgi:hypothetical protein